MYPIYLHLSLPDPSPSTFPSNIVRYHKNQNSESSTLQTENNLGGLTSLRVLYLRSHTGSSRHTPDTVIEGPTGTRSEKETDRRQKRRLFTYRPSSTRYQGRMTFVDMWNLPFTTISLHRLFASPLRIRATWSLYWD